LLSIALVAQGNSKECYLELEIEAAKKIVNINNNYVFDTVLSQFGIIGQTLPTIEMIGEQIGIWLKQFKSKRIEVCFDYYSDFDLLVDAIEKTNFSRGFKTEPVFDPTRLVRCDVAYILSENLTSIETIMNESFN